MITYKEAKHVAKFVWDKSGKPNPQRERAVDKAVSKLVWSNKIYGKTVESTQGICKSTIFRLGNEFNSIRLMPEIPVAGIRIAAGKDPEKEKFIEAVEGIIIGKACESRDRA